MYHNSPITKNLSPPMLAIPRRPSELLAALAVQIWQIYWFIFHFLPYIFRGEILLSNHPPGARGRTAVLYRRRRVGRPPVHLSGLSVSYPVNPEVGGTRRHRSRPHCHTQPGPAGVRALRHHPSPAALTTH